MKDYDKNKTFSYLKYWGVNDWYNWAIAICELKIFQI